MPGPGSDDQRGMVASLQGGLDVTTLLFKGHRDPGWPGGAQQTGATPGQPHLGRSWSCSHGARPSRQPHTHQYNASPVTGHTGSTAVPTHRTEGPGQVSGPPGWGDMSPLCHPRVGGEAEEGSRDGVRNHPRSLWIHPKPQLCLVPVPCHLRVALVTPGDTWVALPPPVSRGWLSTGPWAGTQTPHPGMRS